MKLIFATNNLHKIQEIQAVVPVTMELVTLKEAGIDIDIPEPHDTFHENAAEKARRIFELTHMNCFSEDSGLEVAALHGEPGVRSARYAGDEKKPEKNVEKLLHLLEGETDRNAQFSTVICLILNGNEYYFEGTCAGTISMKPRGKEGFGYDPVFIPAGSDKTFSEMPMEEKSLFSHRKKAVDKLVTFLNTL